MKHVERKSAKTLAAASVKWIYGIVADSVNGLVDAIRPQAEIELVRVRQTERRR